MVAGRRFVRPVLTAFGIAVAALAPAACRDDPTSGTRPFAIEASYASAPSLTVGTAVAPAPTFVVRNSLGDPLANIPVTVTVTTGNGTLVNAPLLSSAGPTSVGTWTLDTIAGVNELTITAGSAPPVKVTINGVADAVATLSSDTGPLTGLAGDFLNSAFTLRARDRFGNPVSGADVDLAVSQGGGVITPLSVSTDSDGRASGISWRLGRHGGAQQVVASLGAVRSEIPATIRSDFDPAMRFHGTALPDELQSALTSAINRLHAGIVADVVDVPVLNFDMSRCGIQGATVNETVDDLVIFAIVAPIDGVGRVLASAGPCILRTQSRFPVIGVMRFDSDDIPSLSSNGRLSAVVLHEMLHVIGIGTLWRARDMLIGSGSTDPRFIGNSAGHQCIAAGGLAPCGDGRVPVENSGGSGTVEVHWRESVFDVEVMTGFVEANGEMPLSAISFASLADLGYGINLLSADPFQVPTPGSVSPRLSPQLIAPWESVAQPLFDITSAGWIRPIAGRGPGGAGREN